MKETLITCYDYNEDMINYIISLCKINLNNNFLEFQEKYYKHKSGIITADNNSVTIALHFIMIRVPQISKTLLPKRFIDEIFFIADNKEISEETIKSLKELFGKSSLKITFR